MAAPAVTRPTNMSFEEPPTHKGQPPGWFNSRGFVDRVSTAYEFRVMPRSEGPGGLCVRVANPRAKPGEFGSLMQRCPVPSRVLGRPTRLEGELTTQDVQGWAGMWLRVDGPKHQMLFFDNMCKRPIRGSTPWTTYAIDCKMPANGLWLNYGVVISGRGAVCADSFRLLVWVPEGRWDPL